tara:strand:+ start:71 stop:439 length:369 start_codon:yes stop_codon:yes gene_type:complete
MLNRLALMLFSLRLNQLVPGRMPLWLAWLVAGAGVPYLLNGLQAEQGGGFFNQIAFAAVLIGATVSAPWIAWKKGRKWSRWAGLSAVGAVLAATLQVFELQPVTVAGAVFLGEAANKSEQSK